MWWKSTAVFSNWVVLAELGAKSATPVLTVMGFGTYGSDHLLLDIRGPRGAHTASPADPQGGFCFPPPPPVPSFSPPSPEWFLLFKGSHKKVLGWDQKVPFASHLSSQTGLSQTPDGQNRSQAQMLLCRERMALAETCHTPLAPSTALDTGATPEPGRRLTLGGLSTACSPLQHKLKLAPTGSCHHQSHWYNMFCHHKLFPNSHSKTPNAACYGPHSSHSLTQLIFCPAD